MKLKNFAIQVKATLKKFNLRSENLSLHIISNICLPFKHNSSELSNKTYPSGIFHIKGAAEKGFKNLLSKPLDFFGLWGYMDAQQIKDSSD